MPGDHVGKKTNDQGEGLGENAQIFNRYQDEFYTNRAPAGIKYGPSNVYWY